MAKRGRAAGNGEHGQGALLRLQGDYWTVSYDGVVVSLRDNRGLRYLEILLRNPGRAFNVADLTAMASGDGPTAAVHRYAADQAIERARKAVTNRIRATVAQIGASHPTLGLHLANAVRTGTTCRYTPERPVAWEA